MTKYQSLTTPNVKHDVFNFLTEVFFVNIYGIVKPFSWRKGEVLATKWPKTLAIIRKMVNKHDISPEQIAWYLHDYKPRSIDAKTFGQMVWKIKRFFRYMSLDKLHSTYLVLVNSDTPNVINDSYSNSRSPQGDDLLSILGNLEKQYGEEKEQKE